MANTSYMVYVVLGLFGTIWLLLTLFPVLVRAKKYNDDKERRNAEDRRKEELHQAQLRCMYANTQGDTKHSPVSTAKPQSSWTQASRSGQSKQSRKRASVSSNRGEAGIVKDFGQANYQWKPKTQLSYFVTLTQGQKEITVWGVGLEQALKVAGCKVGDSVSLVRGGKEDVVVKVRCFDDQGEFSHFENVNTKRQLWKCSIA